MVANLPAALLVPTNQDLKVSVDQSDAGIRLDMNYFTADGSADPEEIIAAIVDAITQAGTTGEVAVRADNASQLSYRNEALGTSMSISAQRLPDLAGTGTEGTQLTYIIVLSAEAAGATPGASTPAQAGPTIIVPTTAASTTGADDGDSGGSSSTMYAILAALAVVGLVGGGWFAWNRGFFAGSTGAAATTLADAPTEQGGQAPAVTVRAVADAGQQTTEVADVSTAIVIRGLLGEGTADIIEEADS
jgi:hypothetical protein